MFFKTLCGFDNFFKKLIDLFFIDGINFPYFFEHDFPILIFEFLKDHLSASFDDKSLDHDSVG